MGRLGLLAVVVAGCGQSPPVPSADMQITFDFTGGQFPDGMPAADGAKMDLTAPGPDFAGIDFRVVPKDGGVVSSGLFRAPVSLGEGTHPVQLFAVDFTSDGKVDLAILHAQSYGAPTVTIRAGDGAGGFGSSKPIWTGVGGTNVHAFAVSGDVSGDGKADIVIRENYDTIVTTLIQGNAGSFTTVTSDPGFTPRGMALGDLDGDQKEDLVLATDTGATTFLSDGAGHFTTKAQLTIGTTDNRPQLVDLDGDGKLDFVTSAANQVKWAPGNGDGSFNAVRTVNALAANHDAISLMTGDFNGDGRLDLMTVDVDLNMASPVGSLVLIPGTGPGQFATAIAPVIIAKDISVAGAADLDGNNILDVALLSADFGGSEQHGLFVVLDGKGSMVKYSWDLPHSLDYTLDLKIADVNGDQIPDILALGDAGSSSGNGDLILFLGM